MPTRLRPRLPPLFYGAISFAHSALEISCMFICFYPHVSKIIKPINDCKVSENTVLFVNNKNNVFEFW